MRIPCRKVRCVKIVRRFQPKYVLAYECRLCPVRYTIFFPVPPWMEIRKRGLMTEDLVNTGREESWYISFVGMRVARARLLYLCPSRPWGRTYRMNGGAAEVNLWARWTAADTMAAFNSTLSTSRNDLVMVVTAVTNFSSDSGAQ